VERRTRVGAGLVVVGLLAFGLVLAVPVQPVHVHDTSSGSSLNESQAEDLGIRVVAYENLSERGQELYVKALENGGTYRVPVGEGAEDFAYPTDEEARAPGGLVEGKSNQTSNVLVIVERPADDGDLPPADERPEIASETRANESTITRYDQMRTRTEKPPIGSGAHVPRLAGLVLGLTSLTAGAYLLVSKP